MANTIRFDFQSSGAENIVSEQKKIEQNFRAIANAASDLNRILGKKQKFSIDVEVDDLDRIEPTLKRISKTAKDATKNVDISFTSVSKSTQKAGKSFLQFAPAANLASDAIGAVGQAAKDAATSTVKAFAEFEQNLATFQAIGGEAATTAEELAIVEAEVRRLGQTTQKSAQEIAAITPELKRAGLDAQQTANILPALTKASIATGESMEALTKGTLLAANTFGQTGSLEENINIVNTIGKAADQTRTTYTQLTQALINAGGVFKRNNVDLQAGSLILQSFAESGVVGSRAGTAARKAVSTLGVSLDVLAGRVEASSPKLARQAEALRDLGISSEDAQQLIAAQDWDAIWSRVSGGLRELEGTGRDSQILISLFGDRLQSQVGGALGVTAEKMQEFREALQDTTGYMDEVAGISADTLAGAYGRVESAIGELQLVAGDAFEPALRAATEFAAQFINAITNGLKAPPAIFGQLLGPLLDGFRDGFGGIPELLYEIFGNAISGLRDILQQIRPLAESFADTFGDRIRVVGQIFTELLSLFLRLQDYIVNTSNTSQVLATALTGVGVIFETKMKIVTGILQVALEAIQRFNDGIQLAQQQIDNLKGAGGDIVGQGAEELTNFQRLANRQVNLEVGTDDEAIQQQINKLKEIKKLTNQVNAVGEQNREVQQKINDDINTRIKALKESRSESGDEVEGGDKPIELPIEADTEPATEAIAEIPDAAAKAEAEAGQALGDIVETRANTAQQQAEDAAKKAEDAAKAARDAAIEAIEKQQIEGEIEIAQFKLDNPNAPAEAVQLQEVEVTRKTLQEKLKLEEAGSKEALSIRKQLIDNEAKGQEALLGLVKRRIDEEIAAQNRLIQEQEIGLRSQKSTLDLVVNSQQRRTELMQIQEAALSRQTDLLNAQKGLQDSLSAIESARLDREVDNAKRGEDAIRQLEQLRQLESDRENEGKEESEAERIKREAKEKEDAIKLERQQRKALEAELKTLGLDRNATVEQAVLARQKAEDEAAKQELENFTRQAEFDRQSLALENQREASAKRRALIEAQINQSKAQQAVIDARLTALGSEQELNTAQGELRKAREEGDAQAIADAQLRVKLAQESLSLSRQAAQEAQAQVPIASSLVEEAQREIATQKEKARIAEQTLANNQKAEAVAKVTAERNRQLEQNRERAEIGANLRDIDATVSLGQVASPTQALQQEIEEKPPVKIPAELEITEQQDLVNEGSIQAQNELVELLKQQIELLRERAVLEAAETAEKLRAAQSEQQAIAESEERGIAEKQARLEELSRPLLTGNIEDYLAREKEKEVLEEEIKAAEERKAEAEKEGARLGETIISTDEILEQSRERLELSRAQTSELEEQARLTQQIANNQPNPTPIPAFFTGGDAPVGQPFSAAETGAEIASFPGSGRSPVLLQSPGVYQSRIPTHIYNPYQTQQILKNWQNYGFPSPSLSPAIAEVAKATVTHNHSNSDLGELVKEMRSQSKTDIKNQNTFFLTKPDQTEQARIFAAGEAQGRKNAEQEHQKRLRGMRSSGGRRMS